MLQCPQLGTIDVTAYKETNRICYIQCTYIISAILYLMQVSENVLSELEAGILNKQN